MLTKRFAVHLNRSLVGFLGVVIEKTDVAHLRSFPCVVVKKTFQFTCGDPETEVDLICREPASSRRQKISMILQFAPLIDQISVPVLGGFVVLLVDVECLEKCAAMVKVRLSRFQKPIGELASVATDSTQDVWKIHITWLHTTLCKITCPVRLRPRLGIGQ